MAADVDWDYTGRALGNVHEFYSELIGRETKNPLYICHRRTLRQRYGSRGWDQGHSRGAKVLDINTPLAKWSEAVREFRPNIIIGYPSAVKILAELTERDKMPLHIKRVISCGEPLSVGLRKFLENAFHAEVINFYGASESLALGVEQWADYGMILFDDLNVIEVIDREMYVTCLYNFTQPLIRYHISDKLVLHEAKNKKR